ncbi:heat-shock protein [Stagnimonas aquatica]|uniref:Heat shock protein 15 n=1 Tax=Stagnimonas aquatica TaxID=2689987 RepID=A0A3N0VE39_9GAMM|nr:S4 domain-containing protein [Stagnimonas aquatica]ROH90935.1 heat-shock protein [Stagnimonas aquatica]
MTPRRVDSLRLDKWLWAARFYKTRNLAKQAIDSGHVKLDGERAKTSKELRPGQRLQLRRGQEEIELLVLALSDQRGGAPEAQTLYEETAGSRERRAQAALERRANAVQHPDGRPTRQQRRAILGYKRGALGDPSA